ncbi:glycerophosphodiester phosphodiesterase [Lapidilactobacillus mulanensis]|uniref:Glycerophosphodiester phosphodiesterase n=1 Tax=Lapidilactobacillus mulanensis TaxID=2485999 RepID=A0ABW4DP90_9LACO|nr:glycerophosphodiester phosphodiesterase family protein [Lapidilactobacillus mulanensis]
MQIKRMFTLFSLAIIWLCLAGFTVVGHRGDPIKQPEETFASFNQAFTDGADYVELDLHVSQDNVLVISHDRNLQRITGQNAIVSQTPWATLKTFKQKNGEPMHSLDELFAYYQNKPNTKFLIETKKTKKGNPQNMEALIAQSVQKYHMESRIMFHSFSLLSLQNLQKLLPSVPRIFIAGTLKKINFDVFQYSTGVNISSTLVNEQIIKQLHAANQKVYVWDQMNESADQWNWLVNLPIDGVVTNYPATGKQYQEAKVKATDKKVSFSGTLLSLKNETSYENPYNLTVKKATIQPLVSYNVDHFIISDGQPYYQIEPNRFISALGFNNVDDINKLTPYLGQQLALKNNLTRAQFYDSPFAPKSTGNYLLPNETLTITSVQYNNDELWLQTKNGWLKTTDIRVNFDPQSLNWRAYQKLPAAQKLATPEIKSPIILHLSINKQNNWQMLADFHYNQIIIKTILG